MGLVIPLSFSFFFLRFSRNYVSIIVNIISNNTVLCYFLWIFVSIRRLLQLIVCMGVSTPPLLKNMTTSFAKSPLKSSKNFIIFPLTPSHLLKITKFLVEIFLSLSILDFNLFFMQKLQPLEKGHLLPSFFVFLLFDKNYFIYQPSFALMNNVFSK